MSLVGSSDIKFGYRTDHNLVTLTLVSRSLPKRGGFWKFNNSLLEDREFVRMIRESITDFKRQYALPVYHPDTMNENKEVVFGVNDQLFLEVLLCHLRGKCIEYSVRRKRFMLERENKLVTEVATLERRVHNDEDNVSLIGLEKASAELKEFRKKRMEGVLLRAKARWIEFGEAPSRYFCGLEKRL